MSPRKNGATIAAIGFTVYGQNVSVPIPWFVMYTAIVVYQAPQMKNCRNIITESLVRVLTMPLRVEVGIENAQGNTWILIFRNATQSPWSCSPMYPSALRPYL